MNKDFRQGFSTRHTPHRNDPHSNDLNTDFPLRIGSVAGDYYQPVYPGAIPMDSADKTVLAMKVASGTGGVGAKHSVPQLLVAVVYSGKDEKTAWDEALKTSRRAMQQANETFEKPANYSGINMLVELDSLQELDVKDSTIKVFRIFDFSYHNHFCTEFVGTRHGCRVRTIPHNW